MNLFAAKQRSRRTIKFHPSTIILISMLLPFVNTIFPSSKGILFTVLFSLSLLFAAGHYKKLCKALMYIFLFLLLYKVVDIYSQSAMLQSMLKMNLLFFPSLLLALFLVSEYNSSELLSGLQALKLPKIFIIGLTVTLRYIPTFRKEFKIIKESMYIRGVAFSLKHPVQTFEYFIVPQLYRCLNLSGELTASGLIKAIDAPCKRTSFYGRRISLADYLVFALLFLGHGLIIGGWV